MQKIQTGRKQEVSHRKWQADSGKQAGGKQAKAQTKTKPVTQASKSYDTRQRGNPVRRRRWEGCKHTGNEAQVSHLNDQLRWEKRNKDVEDKRTTAAGSQDCPQETGRLQYRF